MDIYQLKSFVTVAAEGSITKASELLFLSQPAVSAHIKALEDELGLQLFSRTTKGMSLSAQGLALVTKAQQMLQLQKELLLDAKRLKGELHGSIRLGSNRGSGAKWLGLLLNQLALNYPQLKVDISYGSSAEIQQAILSGTIDAGFSTVTTTDSKLHSLEVEQSGIYLAAPASWDLRPEPDWQQLATLPWIVPAADSCCGRTAAALFALHGFSPANVLSVDQEHMSRALISSGAGLGLLHSESAMEAQAKAEVRLLGLVEQQSRLCFSCQTSRTQEPPLRVAFELMRQLVAH